MTPDNQNVPSISQIEASLRARRAPTVEEYTLLLEIAERHGYRDEARATLTFTDLVFTGPLALLSPDPSPGHTFEKPDLVSRTTPPRPTNLRFFRAYSWIDVLATVTRAWARDHYAFLHAKRERLGKREILTERDCAQEWLETLWQDLFDSPFGRVRALLVPLQHELLRGHRAASEETSRPPMDSPPLEQCVAATWHRILEGAPAGQALQELRHACAVILSQLSTKRERYAALRALAQNQLWAVEDEIRRRDKAQQSPVHMENAVRWLFCNQLLHGSRVRTPPWMEPILRATESIPSSESRDALPARPRVSEVSLSPGQEPEIVIHPAGQPAARRALPANISPRTLLKLFWAYSAYSHLRSRRERNQHLSLLSKEYEFPRRTREELLSEPKDIVKYLYEVVGYKAQQHRDAPEHHPSFFECLAAVMPEVKRRLVRQGKDLDAEREKSLQEASRLLRESHGLETENHDQD